MKTLRFITAAAAFGLLAAAAPSFAQNDQNNANMMGGQNTTGGMMNGSNMQKGMMGMNGMNAMDAYRMHWVYYNLDAASMKRYMGLGYDEKTIKGAANIALRSGLDMDYVLSRVTITGLPLTQVAVMLGVPANTVDADIAGMGGMMMGGGMGNMNGSMNGSSGGGMMGGTSR